MASAINTGRTIHNIPLEIQSPVYPELVFLRAEMNVTQMTPFALVWYAISKRERTKALRLDLDKRKFIGLEDLETPEFRKSQAAWFQLLSHVSLRNISPGSRLTHRVRSLG
jgi:hypothetical protein